MKMTVDNVNASTKSAIGDCLADTNAGRAAMTTRNSRSPKCRDCARHTAFGWCVRDIKGSVLASYRAYVGGGSSFQITVKSVHSEKTNSMGTLPLGVGSSAYRCRHIVLVCLVNQV